MLPGEFFICTFQVHLTCEFLIQELLYICLSKECYYKLILPELNSDNIFGFYLGSKWVYVLFGQSLDASVIELCRLVSITTGILAKIPYREIRTGPTGTRSPLYTGLNTYSARSGHYSTGNNDRSLITAIVHQERSVSQELATSVALCLPN